MKARLRIEFFYFLGVLLNDRDFVVDLGGADVSELVGTLNTEGWAWGRTGATTML